MYYEDNPIYIEVLQDILEDDQIVLKKGEIRLVSGWAEKENLLMYQVFSRMKNDFVWLTDEEYKIIQK